MEERVTIGLIRGANAHGHMGWVTVRCRVCGRHLSLTGQQPGATRRVEVVYACPKCAKEYNAYFCHADARRFNYRCPFCGRELVVVSPIHEEE